MSKINKYYFIVTETKIHSKINTVNSNMDVEAAVTTVK